MTILLHFFRRLRIDDLIFLNKILLNFILWNSLNVLWNGSILYISVSLLLSFYQLLKNAYGTLVELRRKIMFFFSNGISIFRSHTLRRIIIWKLLILNFEIKRIRLVLLWHIIHNLGSIYLTWNLNKLIVFVYFFVSIDNLSMIIKHSRLWIVRCIKTKFLFIEFN